jgi:peptidoglycan/xylan/chitin deacetylase (PgdA/CDA1 family)
MGWTGSGKVVSLSFDDGPGPYTSQILDVLQAKKVPATFCQIGEQVANYRAIERRIVANGFLLCNHSWDHDEHLSRHSLSVIEQEMSRTQHAVKSAAGKAPVYYRAPGGDFGDPVKRAAAHEHLPLLAWAVDTRDWTRPGVDAIVDAVLDHVTPGAVILLHDGGGNRSETVAALPRIIDGLRAMGYGFTTPPRHPAT